MDKFMLPGVIGILMFIIIVNGYHILKNRKKKARRAGNNTVKAFKTNYRKDIVKDSQDKEYIKYITKYNSSLDFIDKDEFLEDASKLKSREKSGYSSIGSHNNFM